MDKAMFKQKIKDLTEDMRILLDYIKNEKPYIRRSSLNLGPYFWHDLRDDLVRMSTKLFDERCEKLAIDEGKKHQQPNAMWKVMHGRGRLHFNNDPECKRLADTRLPQRLGPPLLNLWLDASKELYTMEKNAAAKKMLEDKIKEKLVNHFYVFTAYHNTNHDKRMEETYHKWIGDQMCGSYSARSYPLVACCVWSDGWRTHVNENVGANMNCARRRGNTYVPSKAKRKPPKRHRHPYSRHHFYPPWR